jgi:ATP-dependent helicase HrpA
VRLGSHLVKRLHAEPHWSRKRASVVARERVLLYGVPLVADRLVTYGSIDPELSRELFIRHALVQGEWQAAEDGRHAFLTDNARLVEEAEELEHRARRRDIVVDEHTLFDFYDARIPAGIVSGAHFDQWWKRESRSHPRLLTFDPAMLTHDTAGEVAASDFPTRWEDSDTDGLTFPISYHFEPGAEDDGLTIDVPVSTLNRVGDDDFSWLVPGLREELVTDLIRSLPKQLRVSFVPAPDTARSFLAAVPPGDEPLLDALERHLRSTTGVVVPREAWDWSRIAPHLRPTFRVVDERGREAGRGKDLERLKAPLRPRFEEAVAEVAAERTATGQTTWTFDTIEESWTQRRAGHEVRVHPCLVDEGGSVGLRVVGSADEAAARHRLGVRRLVLLALGPAPAALARAEALDQRSRLALAGSPYPSIAALVEDCRLAAVGEVVDAAPVVRDRAAYDAVVAQARASHEDRVVDLLRTVVRVLDAWRQADQALSGRADLHTLPALTDMRAQVDRLMAPGFVAEAGPRLVDYPRWLAAVVHRRERLEDQVARDRQLMDQVADTQEAWLHQVQALPQGRPPGEALREARWMLEDYRVSLWAQHLGTPRPVSDKRIRAVLRTPGA